MPNLLDALPRNQNKQRTLSDNGNGASSGIVLTMDMVSTSYNAVAYTIPVQVGPSQQNLSLQVDTGSSDLWIASKSCSSASCSATGGRLYDPSASQPTGATLTMQYLAGSFDGPIVWDQVQIGGYIIPSQALAAATAVNSEPLSHDFDGILGLALPSNSLIQQIIPATTGNVSDGATISSNLLSLTPTSNAPSQAFFSLTLGRPGFNQIPSLLGIGRHPPDIVPDPSQIRYSSLVSDSAGMLFWKTTVRAITVYVNGHAYRVALQSLSGGSAPTALLDSGVPLIMTTTVLANGIYGALGIGPASDGNYYLPCATPLNMTITLDGQEELSLHPLDLTMEPDGQENAQYCTGLIQTDPSRLTATSDIGDMVLGVPFMRNVYTVLAYERPDNAGIVNNSVSSGTNPMLGLLGLTNATQAMAEFEQVRVANVPLGSGESPPPPSTMGAGQNEFAHSVGIQILIGLVGFFVLCLALFAVRWFYVRRRLQRSSPEDDQNQAVGAYRPSVDQRTLLSLHTKDSSRYTIDSGRTRVGEDEGEERVEFGVRIRKFKLGSGGYPADLDMCDDDPWHPYAGTWGDTIVGTEAGESDLPPVDLDSPRESSMLMMQQHYDSGEGDDSGAGELGGTGEGMEMAGIGTAARGSVIDATLQHGRPSLDSATSSTASFFRSSYMADRTLG